MHVKYSIKPKQVFIVLAILVLVLTAQSLFTEYLIENTSLKDQGDSVIVLVLDLFSVNLEESIPTWFATIILFVASILLGLIALHKRQEKDLHRLYWAGLAVIFMYLSMDEGAVIHEILADPLQQKFNTTGFFYFGWQLVAIPLVFIFVVVYARFLWRLPRKFAALFVLSGIIYVGGAVVVEGISASRWYSQGSDMTYLAIATVEEFCEMLGVVVFIYSLLTYMVEMNYGFIWQSEDAEAVAATTEATAWPSNLRFIVGGVVLLLITNMAGLVWVTGQENNNNENNTSETNQLSQSQALLETLDTDGVFIVEVNDVFSFENTPMLEIIVTLLPDYDEVIVLSLVSSESSLILAGNDLAFDQNSLTESLTAIGETQYIIFDTPVLEALAPQFQTSE